jgi:site-specific recombinase XerD
MKTVDFGTNTVSSLAESFLLTKQNQGCTKATVTTYDWWLGRFVEFVGDQPLSYLLMQKFFKSLRDRGLGEGSQHQAFRVVQTFILWGVDVEVFPENYLGKFKVANPYGVDKHRPWVPGDDDVRTLYRASPSTGFTGKRNRAIIVVLADCGLRATELTRLLVEHYNPVDRTLFVRMGKGKKDRTVPMNPITARAIRAWLDMRPRLAREDFLFADRRGNPIKRRNLVRILHRLSKRAGLSRRIHPHALRGFAMTTWLRNGIGLDQVRRLMGHSTLDVTLMYSALTSADLIAAHRQAAGIERLGL